MGLFDAFRRKKDKPSAQQPQDDVPAEPPPSFAPFFKSAAEYDKFESAVRAYFKKHGHSVLVTELSLRVAPRRDGHPSPYGSQEYGLENIGQFCARRAGAEWPTLIADHFDKLLQSETDRDKTDGLSWDDLQHRLGIRLMEVSDNPLFEWTLWREDLPGIASMVFVDEPTAITSFKHDRLSRLNVLSEHVFESALDNLQTLAPVNRSAFSVQDGNEIVLLEGESPFSAAHALRLDQHEGVLGRHGAFVSVPTRHTVLILPFNNLDVIRAIPHLVNITAMMNRDGPGSVSTKIYWIHDDARIPLPYELTEQGMKVSPPDELTSYLNSLAESEEQT